MEARVASHLSSPDKIKFTSGFINIVFELAWGNAGSVTLPNVAKFPHHRDGQFNSFCCGLCKVSMQLEYSDLVEVLRLALFYKAETEICASVGSLELMNFLYVLLIV